MSTNWKKLYKEAKQENEQLTAELQRTAQVVDLAGIARHMRVERYTPQQWKMRKLLPPVDFPAIREPLWYASSIIEKFARPTRRIWYTDEDLAAIGDEDLAAIGDDDLSRTA